MRLVVDLEGTCGDDGSIPTDETETIEIGAVITDDNGLELAAYSTLVQPVLHPQLTVFCTSLTGITQDDVNHAPCFPLAYFNFTSWAEMYLGGAFTFCSWGPYDWQQIQSDCRQHQVTILPITEHFDVSSMFTKRYGKRRAHRGAMVHLGITPEGRHHRGLDDARNVAKVLQHLIQN